MCVVSAVSGYYTRTWPERNPLNPKPWIEDLETKRMLQEILLRLNELDKRTKDTDCHEESKEQFLKEIFD